VNKEMNHGHNETGSKVTTAAISAARRVLRRRQVPAAGTVCSARAQCGGAAAPLRAHSEWTTIQPA